MADDRTSNGGPMDEGWIKKHRSVRDHWLVGHGLQVKPADPSRKHCLSKGEAWEDLLMECRYEDGTVNNGGTKMELRRGELLGAVSWLAHRWNWTPKTVRVFLAQLESDEMIELKRNGIQNGKQKGKQANTISVCNYEKYQSTAYTYGQAERQLEGKQGASKGQAKGNIYKEKKGRTEEVVTPLAPLSGGDGPEEGRPKREGRGERLPEDWVLPKSWGNWALEHFHVSAGEVRTEAASFKDYWVSRAGSQARKKNWLATWRNWIRTEAGRKKWKIKVVDTTALSPDDDASGDSVDFHVQIASMSDSEQRELVAAHANGIWPIAHLGSPPGHKNCSIRPENYQAVGITKDTYDDMGLRRGKH